MSSKIVEVREYTLHPGRRDDLIALFEERFVEPQTELGIELLGLFRDADRPNRFIWIRGFADMPARERALREFYGGPVWAAARDRANETMIDSDNVLLLEPVAAGSAAAASLPAGPLLLTTYLLDGAAELKAFRSRWRADVLPRLEQSGIRCIAAYVSTGPNNFPTLPVREGVHAFVALLDGADRAHVAWTSPSEVAELVPTTRSQLQFQTRGRRGDFDFLIGEWRVAHRKLRERLVRCDEWIESAGTCRAYSLADGVVSVDEITVGASEKGCSIRHLDLERQRWTIFWTTSASGKLFEPVSGGFDGDDGVFYGWDTVGECEVRVRYRWTKGSRPRWEQAFSTDGGSSWETNWIMDFERDA